MTHNIIQFTSKNIKVLPQRLREAREVLEMSMVQLAEQVGITRQAISFYEAGERTPEPNIMMKLVQVLEQPISFFTTERPKSFGIRDTIYFRSYKSKTKKTNRHCEILANWLSEVAYYLNTYINIPNVNLPQIMQPEHGSYYTIQEIENAATECRRYWGLNDGPIGDLVGLLESKGIIVSRPNFGINKVNAFSFWEGGRPFILLGSDRHSACMSRFDAAHELGHIILHRGVSECELESDLDRIEKEANHFASAFLLPASSYPLEVFSTRLQAFIELKKRWKVSIAAQIYRNADLRLINEDQILNLRKQLSANKWRTNEPLDKEMALEQPQLIEKCFNMLINNNIKSSASILSDINLSKNILEKMFSMKFHIDDYCANTYVNLHYK